MLKKPKIKEDDKYAPKSDFAQRLTKTLSARGLKVDPKMMVFGPRFELIKAKFTPTDVIEVDAILGEDHGLPSGTLVEFCGEPQSGKSYLALKTIASVQKRGGRGAVVDIENSFVESRARDLGVIVDDDDKFIKFQNYGTAEEYGELIKVLVDTGEFDIIVVDSISAMIPSADYNKDFSEKNRKMGAHAMFVGDFTRALLSKCSLSDTTVILINQFRYKSGSMPGTFIKGATGGEAIGFYCHMRLWISKLNGQRGWVLNAKKERIGGKSKLKVMKTRYGTPDIFTEFPIMFQKGGEGDAVIEFLNRCGVHPELRECITFKYKKYAYVDLVPGGTGEIYAESKDPYDFVTMLSEASAPSKLKRGDGSKTGFEWACGRLNYVKPQIDAVFEGAKNGPVVEIADGSDADVEYDDPTPPDLEYDFSEEVDGEEVDE